MTIASNPFYEVAPDFDVLIVFGAGGFGREVAWLAEQSWGSKVRRAFVVDDPAYLRPPVNGVPVQLLSEVVPTPSSRFLVAIGDPAIRRRAVDACLKAGLVPGFLIHPRAEASKWIKFDAGVIICAGVVATTNITVGPHVHVNLDCTIGHDVSIGEFTTLAPGVHVSGNVQIGRNVYIGTGASLINGDPERPLVIGDGAVVAAGACVIGPVAAGALVAGVPAQRKR